MTDLGIAVKPVETGSRGAVRMFLRNKAAVVGLVVFSLIVLVTIFGPGLYGTSARKMVAPPFLGPGDDLGPLLGTDYLGRDILAGLIIGGRTTLLVEIGRAHV
jgi:peptide/nickel transport system permease protein